MTNPERQPNDISMPNVFVLYEAIPGIRSMQRQSLASEACRGTLYIIPTHRHRHIVAIPGHTNRAFGSSKHTPIQNMELHSPGPANGTARSRTAP